MISSQSLEEDPKKFEELRIKFVSIERIFYIFIHFKNKTFSNTKYFLNYYKNLIAFHSLNNTTNYI